MPTVDKRLAALERRRTDADDVLAISFHGSDMVSVKGVEMPRAEFYRLHPTARTIQLSWGDEHVTDDNSQSA